MDESSGFLRQAAAIPIQGQRVCLVTSSNGKRWVIPKGVIDPGHTAGQAALQEAWEEAGLTGTLGPQPVGSYVYDKWGRACHVIVFRMSVVAVSDDWPERHVRQRIWVAFAEAVQRVEDAGLRKVLEVALGQGPGGP
jgi:8-oxo-dGTP pyrophosphatase MutT (NUDIX family)